MQVQFFEVGHSNCDIPNKVRLPLTSGVVGSVAIGMPDRENMVFEFRRYLAYKLGYNYTSVLVAAKAPVSDF